MTKKVFIMQLVQRISSFFPALKKEIKIAHLRTSPQQFIYDNIKFSLLFSLGLTVLFFFIVDKADLPLILLPVAFLFLFIFMFYFYISSQSHFISKIMKNLNLFKPFYL